MHLKFSYLFILFSTQSSLIPKDLIYPLTFHYCNALTMSRYYVYYFYFLKCEQSIFQQYVLKCPKNHKILDETTIMTRHHRQLWHALFLLKILFINFKFYLDLYFNQSASSIFVRANQR